MIPPAPSTITSSPAATDAPPPAPAPSGPWYSRARLGVWVESNPVQRFVIAVILLNAVVLGLFTSATVRESVGTWLTVIDTVCLAIFVIELLIKLYAFRGKFFRSAWNVFDFFVIAVALIPGSGFAVLRALRVLRVLRLVSMLPQLRRVVEALVRAVPGILSIGALLILLFYVAAVMATMLFGDSFDEYFGTIGRSLASLFQTMTMDNWSNIAREVTAVYGWAWAFFVPFILLSAFTVLNLFIAVMVDAMRFLSTDGPASPNAEEESSEEPAGPAVHDGELLAEVRALRAELAAYRAERNQN